jgi:hypothetical protein
MHKHKQILASKCMRKCKKANASKKFFKQIHNQANIMHNKTNNQAMQM